MQDNAIPELIFDGFPRKGNRPRLNAEPDFDYLNQSGRPEAEAVRQMLETWFARYPATDRQSLRHRMRNGEFQSATFELFSHALLRGLGFEMEVHPPLEDTPRSPDFLAFDSKQSNFFVECTCVTDDPDDTRLKVLLDGIERLGNRGFWLQFSYSGVLTRAPSANRVKRQLERWLSSYDAANLRERIESGEDVPPLSTVIQESGLEIRAEAFPRPRKLQTCTDARIVGGWYSSGVRTIETDASLCKAVRRKAGHYGDFDRPFVIFVNVVADSLHDIAKVDALLGRETVIDTMTSDGDIFQRHGRMPDGAFHGPGGVQYTRVSGIVIVNHFSPWNLAATTVDVIPHPDPRFPIPADLHSLRTLEIREERCVFRPGIQPKEIFNLPDGWPQA